METGIKYVDGIERADPKVRVDVRVQIMTDDGLSDDDYLDLVKAVAIIKRVTKKYKEQK